MYWHTKDSSMVASQTRIKELDAVLAVTQLIHVPEDSSDELLKGKPRGSIPDTRTRQSLLGS